MNFEVNGTQSTISSGVEYFSAQDQRIRRDWTQLFDWPGCPLVANAGGTEWIDW